MASAFMSSNKNSLINALLSVELDPLWRFALQITRDKHDAEDLLQRTCLRAIEKCDSYVDSDKRRSWLFKIAQNIWKNELRSKAIRDRGYMTPAVAENGVAAGQLVDWQTPDTHLEVLDVANAVESLPDAQRMVIFLVAVEGFSYSEAATILEIPIGTVMSRLARARLALGKQFAVTHKQNCKLSPSMKNGSIQSPRQNRSRKKHITSSERPAL